MLPEEAYFFRPRNLDQSNSRPDQTAQLFVRTPQPLPPKKGSAFFGNTWPHCVLYSSKNQRSQPLYRRIRQRRRSASSRKQKIGMEGVEPSSQFPADYFENKVELEFEGKSYPTPAESDKVFTIRYGGWSQLPPENDCIAHGVVVEPRNVSQSPKTSPLPMPTKLE